VPPVIGGGLARQLEGTYGIHADGTFEPLERLTYLDAVGWADRWAIAAAVRHEELALSSVEGAAGAGRREAVERYVRESAFTFLNRLAALKLMEHPSRALIQPSVGAGDQSKGFQPFSLLSPEAMRAQPDGGYRLYLELLFDDLSQALGVLFYRTLPTSILFPTQSCLQEVLDLLNDRALEAVWAEDWATWCATCGKRCDCPARRGACSRSSKRSATRCARRGRRLPLCRRRSN